MIPVPPNTTLVASANGQTMPVVAQRSGEVEVRLPGRPNGSTKWMKVGSVKIADTPYAIVIDLGRHHLRLYKEGKLLDNFPVGNGKASTPTPTGNFYVYQFDRSPSAGYGPYVIETSAHSNVIKDWENSGDARIGIHGPLGTDAAIGSKGVAESHGCIRMHVSNLLALRNVPLGTPITIIS